MKNLLKVVGASGLLCLVFAMSASAQIVDALTFTTTFAFYAGNTKMPAGSYKITASNLDEAMLLIEDARGAHSAFLDFTPTQAASAHASSDVTFKKYGNVDFLTSCWVRAQKFGMQMEPSKYQKKLAASGQPQEHSVPAK
jgi:hypothetical protein